MKRVALLASCDSFEKFFGGTFGLNRDQYVSAYRNDFLWDYAAGLKRQGHAVTIYVLSYGRSERRTAEDGLAVRFLHLPLWLRPVDAVLYRLRKLRHGPAARDRVAFAAFGRELKRALVEDRIDLLYVQEFWTHRFDLVARDTAIPILGADHGALYQPGTDAEKRASFAGVYKLLCQSTPQLERVRALGGDAVLLTNGVDIDFHVPRAHTGEKARTALAVGRLVDPQKRFSDLLRAMQRLPDFTLTIVGSGPDNAMLQALARDLGVAAQVTFAGFVSRTGRQLRAMYQSCGVFVSASAWEAMALVMLEAMSCGAAVVGTRIGTFEDLLTDGVDGRLVAVGDPEELARAIRDAYDRRVILGQNARRTVVERYSSEATFRRLSQLIEAA